MAGDEDEETDGRMIVWPLERLARLMRAREHEDGLNPAQREALRFLSRANRFSNSPGSLTRYLGATKGTVSQTVMALERKGFITKSLRAGGRKTISLTLTDKGKAALARDPWSGLAKAADELGGKTRRRLARGLSELLEGELLRSGLASFGACSTCRYFRERGRSDDAKGPHLCMLFEEPLTEDDAGRICREHQPAD
jgi:DNA-binding MarR family transcriptional regulator